LFAIAVKNWDQEEDKKIVKICKKLSVFPPLSPYPHYDRAYSLSENGGKDYETDDLASRTQ
jgi:hypothetical protein